MGLFSLSLVLHILLWRWRTPRNYLRSLMVVFLIVPLIGAGVLWYVMDITLVEWLAILLLHLSLSIAYIFTYPAVQARCPSLYMLLLIGDSMPAGLAPDSLKVFFDADSLRDSRLRDLIELGLVRESNGLYSITGTGRVVISLFILFRGVLGLPMGRG